MTTAHTSGHGSHSSSHGAHAHGTPSSSPRGHGSHAPPSSHSSHASPAPHDSHTTIDDYLTAQHKAEISQTRLYRLARQAYDAGLDAISDDVSKLSEENGRSSFMHAFKESLEAAVTNASAVYVDEDGDMAKYLAIKGFYGFTAEEFAKFVEGVQGGLTFDTYVKGFLMEPEQSGFTQSLKTRQRYVLEILDQVPAAEVLHYVHVEGADAEKVTLQDKYELLHEYNSKGMVIPKFLEGKEYMSSHQAHDAHGSHAASEHAAHHP